MKAYCENCKALQPSHFRPANDANSGEPYEDLCCDECAWIITSVQERASETDRYPAA